MPKSSPSRGGLWAAIVDEIMRKLKSDPPRYVSAITMGAGQLNDAIVQRTASGIDLSPVLRGVGATDTPYELEFSRLDPLKVRWNGASGSVDAAALATGLFQVRLKGPPPSEAWVLIVGSGALADETIKREAELRAVVGGWRDNADIEGRNAGRTLYRAFLAQAAERMNAPAQ